MAGGGVAGHDLVLPRGKVAAGVAGAEAGAEGLLGVLAGVHEGDGWGTGHVLVWLAGSAVLFKGHGGITLLDAVGIGG